ncbi:deaminase domain-containing protein [Chryseobacterium sp. R2ACT005]|uniref:deaminase domain-containing protein n=1 Tax=Chryseobacterium sp. R2ACT005 TaxID=3416668 RepID=UPI003CE9FA87
MQKDLIHKARGRNGGYIEGEIGNIKFEGDYRQSGEKIYIEEPIFNAYKVDREGGVNTQKAWLRNDDTEYIMLSEIARKLGAKKGGVYPEIKGQIKIVSELPYYLSCQGVIQDFSKMFPNVKINLTDNVKF